MSTWSLSTFSRPLVIYRAPEREREEQCQHLQLHKCPGKSTLLENYDEANICATSAGKLDSSRESAPEQSTQTKPEPIPPGVFEILTPHPGVDFTSFSSHSLQKIRRNWVIPEGAKNGEDKGKVTVRLTIEKDGSLGGAPVVEVSSGKKPLDEAALSAIRASGPFEHLPDFKGPKIDFRLAFFYNLRPPGLNPYPRSTP